MGVDVLCMEEWVTHGRGCVVYMGVGVIHGRGCAVYGGGGDLEKWI